MAGDLETFENKMKNPGVSGVDKATSNSLLVFQKMLNRKQKEESSQDLQIDLKSVPLLDIGFKPTLNNSSNREAIQTIKNLVEPVYNITKVAIKNYLDPVNTFERTQNKLLESYGTKKAQNESEYTKNLREIKSKIDNNDVNVNKLKEERSVAQSVLSAMTSVATAFSERGIDPKEIEKQTKKLEKLDTRIEKEEAKANARSEKLTSEYIDLQNQYLQTDLRLDDEVDKAFNDAIEKRDRDLEKQAEKERKREEKRLYKQSEEYKQYKADQARVTAEFLEGVQKMPWYTIIVNEGEDDAHTLNPFDEDQTFKDFLSDLGNSMGSIWSSLKKDFKSELKKEGLNLLGGFISKKGGKGSSGDSPYVSRVRYEDKTKSFYLITPSDVFPENIRVANNLLRIANSLDSHKSAANNIRDHYKKIWKKDHSNDAENILIQKQMGIRTDKTKALCQALHKIRSENPALVGCAFDLYFPSIDSIKDLDKSVKDVGTNWRNFRLGGFTIPEATRPDVSSIYGYSNFTTLASNQATVNHTAEVTFIIDKNLDQLEYILLGAGLLQRTTGTDWKPTSMRKLNLSSIANPTLNTKVEATLKLRNGRDIAKMAYFENNDWQFDKEAPTKKYLKMDYSVDGPPPDKKPKGVGRNISAPQDVGATNGSGSSYETLKVEYAKTLAFKFKNFKIVNASYSLGFDSKANPVFEVKATCTWTQTLLEEIDNEDAYYEGFV